MGQSRGASELDYSYVFVHLSNPDDNSLIRGRNVVQIGADGANSPVKSYSDIETFGWAYDRQGVVSSLDLDPSTMGEGTHTAWQRFLPEGPIAFLPVSILSTSLIRLLNESLVVSYRIRPLHSFGPLLQLMQHSSSPSQQKHFPTSSTSPSVSPMPNSPPFSRISSHFNPPPPLLSPIPPRSSHPSKRSTQTIYTQPTIPTSPPTPSHLSS